jgi:hypothetical protein
MILAKNILWRLSRTENQRSTTTETTKLGDLLRR